MSSLWTDLLFLHGYITDLKLARQPVEPKQAPEADSNRRKCSPATTLRAWTARLCLGIGDGEPRTQ
jgi:hypothetical protein